jgi:predicted NUDIX family NTP pyrophosphohydrolase
MPERSAGILVFRRSSQAVEVFLAHPGGPFWARKDEHAWSIPKGLYGENEDPLSAAKREFEEETSISIDGRFVPLGEFRQPGGKLITAYVVEADVDETRVKSNFFEMEWFDIETAARKMHKGQIPILHALVKQLEIVRQE